MTSFKFLLYIYTVVQTQILQINILPKIFLECQNANMKIAQAYDDNVDTSRNWRSPTSGHYTHTYICCYTCDRWATAHSWSSWGNLWTYFLLFISWLCGMSVLVTTIWHVLTLRMEKLCTDMESSCKYIKCTEPDRSQTVALQLCVRARC